MAETEFVALPDGREVAYRWFSHEDGPLFVHCPGGMVPIEVLGDDPPYELFLRQLGRYGSVVAFDPLGKGSSDPFDPDSDFIDQVVTAFVGVVEACEAAAAWLVGAEYPSVPAAARIAHSRPDRLAGALLLNPPGGRRRLEVDDLLERGDSNQTSVVTSWMPSRASDPAYRRWHERAGRLGASASTARLLNDAFDRSLQKILAEGDPPIDGPPTLVAYRSSRVAEHQLRWWVRHLSNPTPVEVGGGDGQPNGDDPVALARLFGRFATGLDADVEGVRTLAGLLFIDLVASTEQVAAAGDVAWRGALDRYEALVEEAVDRYAGRVVKHIGDGTLAVFSTGSGAVAAADAIRGGLAVAGLSARLGVHVGEVDERTGGDVSGQAVHIAARVMAAAGADQVVASDAARNACIGTNRTFEAAGEFELKGVDGTWPLFEVPAGPR